jgi:transposase
VKPTYEELESELQQAKTLLKKALEEIGKLSAEIIKLKEKINRNSKNSSKSPSSDQKGNTSNDGEKGERKKRSGIARSPYPPERIDKQVECTRENCPHCGSNHIQPSNEPPEILQQAELPRIEAIVTEYLRLKYGCNSCGKNSIAQLPEGIPDSAFGPNLMGLLATLTGVFHLAKREAAQLIKDLYGVDMGVGSVSNIEERIANALDPIYKRIHKFVIKSAFCKHFDETGWRNSGKKHFVWLATCVHAAFYMIDTNRNAKAFERLVGGNPEGLPAVTDRYALYKKVGKIHQYCLAHLIREFRRYAEREGLDKEIGKALEEELRAICQVHRNYREEKIPLSERNRRLGHRKRKLRHWLEDGMANGSNELSQLCESLIDDFEKLWTFSKTVGMEPTNNLAERDLRKLVVWRKKSYGTRSDRGKKFVERITSIAQTLRRQGMNVLSFVQKVIVSFYSKSEAPPISEAMGF